MLSEISSFPFFDNEDCDARVVKGASHSSPKKARLFVANEKYRSRRIENQRDERRRANPEDVITIHEATRRLPERTSLPMDSNRYDLFILVKVPCPADVALRKE